MPACNRGSGRTKGEGVSEGESHENTHPQTNRAAYLVVLDVSVGPRSSHRLQADPVVHCRPLRAREDTAAWFGLDLKKAGKSLEKNWR